MPENPTTPAIEWTEHTNKCFSCRRRFRISKDALALAKEGWAKEYTAPGETLTDAEVAELFDVCIECVDGEHHEGEHLDERTHLVAALREIIRRAPKTEPEYDDWGGDTEDAENWGQSAGLWEAAEIARDALYKVGEIRRCAGCEELKPVRDAR